MKSRPRTACFALLALLGIGSGSVLAQQSAYPTKPIRFIIPVPPGGGADLLARTHSQKLAETSGQTLVIENRGGAGGTIALELAAKAAPDGYTIVMGLIASAAVNVSLIALPYDPIKDFAPITLLAVAQNMLVVHPSLPAASVKELVALLKSRPGHYHYASAGNGTSPHLSAELFKLMTGVTMSHVPYKGAGPALVDLIGGQVEIYFGSLPATLPQVKTGKLRVLAVTGSRRSRIVPDLPTVAEAGVPGFNKWGRSHLSNVLRQSRQLDSWTAWHVRFAASKEN